METKLAFSRRRTLKCLIYFSGLCAALSFSCGIKLGSNVFRDPIPSGTLVAQGSFTGQNGKTVSGTALIYKTGDVSYVLRLSGVSFPSESGQQIYVVMNGQTRSPIELRGPTGDQNYDVTGGMGAPRWDLVRIYSTVYATDYAQAVLINE